MGFLAVQQLAAAAEYGHGRDRFYGCVVSLRNSEIPIVLTNIDVDNVVVTLDQRLNVGLMKTVIEREAIKAPAGTEDQKDALVILGGGSQRLSDVFVCVGAAGKELTQPGRDSVLCQWSLLSRH